MLDHLVLSWWYHGGSSGTLQRWSLTRGSGSLGWALKFYSSPSCLLTASCLGMQWDQKHSKKKKNFSYICVEHISAVPHSILQYFCLECVYSLKVHSGLWITSAMSKRWNSFLDSTTCEIIGLKWICSRGKVKSKLMGSWRKSQYFAVFYTRALSLWRKENWKEGLIFLGQADNKSGPRIQGH